MESGVGVICAGGRPVNRAVEEPHRRFSTHDFAVRVASQQAAVRRARTRAAQIADLATNESLVRSSRAVPYGKLCAVKRFEWSAP
eukprot:4981509-Pleurochrysis_carterae.AAC.5